MDDKPKLRQQLLTYRDLRDMGIPFSRSALRRHERAGTFPCRLMISPQLPVWDAVEVSEWLETKRAERARRIL